MSESKILKAKCRRTGTHYCMELREYDGEWKVVNMIRVGEEEAKVLCSEVKQPQFRTNQNLLACTKCGNRVIGGCSCAPKLHACSSSMPYRFDCVYCKEFELDYSRHNRKGPYTEWAGMSNIPDAVKDRYGNPQGSQYDLAEDGSFTGYRIVALNLCEECGLDGPKQALEKKGFVLEEYRTAPSADQLRQRLDDDKTQLWLISDRVARLNQDQLRVIEDYFESGHGVYIWGDNEPYYADANKLLPKLFGSNMTGNSLGDKVLGIQTADRAPGIIANHFITTGIVSFYEGITIAEVKRSQSLEPLIYGSNGLLVAAYYDQNGKKALVDGGFTRLFYKWDSAGTDRYVVNAACWLANIERFGYDN